ncbi:MAG: hypothetical protein WC455_18090 [Dehalococcoidia bacterium]
MKRSAKLAVVVYIGLALGGISKGDVFSRIPEADRAIISTVAAEYHLTADQRRLLFAIRLTEAGGAGREMGVLTPAAQRFKGDHAKSLRLQVQYAAGTISKRFTGDVAAFARRWCPPSADPVGYRNFVRNVEKFLAG